MELDCGWVLVGGGSPAEYLHKYSNRISMLHVKDFREIHPVDPEALPTAENVPPVSAELGQGSIDYKPIFAAASRSTIKHCFVEQEQYDMPYVDALRIDATYMRDLKA